MKTLFAAAAAALLLLGCELDDDGLAAYCKQFKAGEMPAECQAEIDEED